MMLLDILEQANIAAKQKNWSLVTQYFQQIPLDEKSKVHYSSELNQILSLALQVLESGDFQEKWDVAKIFSKLGEIAIAPLISIIQDEDAELETRWFSTRILAEFNQPEVIIALANLLDTTEDEELAAMAAEALANSGNSAIFALTSLLENENTRLLAVRSLAQIRQAETIVPLLKVVDDRSASVRASAIEALSSFHDPRIPSVLINALKDLSPQVRKEAVIGLGIRANLQAELDLLNQLKPMLFDFNLEVCRQAAIAIGRLGTDDAAKVLFEVLTSSHTPVVLQIDIVRCLGWIGTKKALEYLQQALNEQLTDIYQEIVIVLGKVEQPNLTELAAKILIEIPPSAYPVDSSSFKQSLAFALGNLKELVGLEPLIQMLADGDATVKFHAIAALKKIPNAYPRLEQLYGDRLTPELEQGIAIALQEWDVNN